MNDTNNDPYIGKIVMFVEVLHQVFDFDKNDSYDDNEFCEYTTESLFYVLTTKEKEYAGFHHVYYILKPLNSDARKENLDKQPVWHYRFFVGSEYNDKYFKIVE